MKVTGVVLILAGILMLIFTNINFTTEKKIVDLGPVQINQKQNNSIGWPSWVGGVAIIAGVVLFVADKKKL